MEEEPTMAERVEDLLRELFPVATRAGVGGGAAASSGAGGSDCVLPSGPGRAAAGS